MFKVSSDEESEEESYWNTFNLIPDSSRYEQFTAIKYARKAVCAIVAGSDPVNLKLLYENTCASDVWEQLAIRKAINYRRG